MSLSCSGSIVGTVEVNFICKKLPKLKRFFVDFGRQKTGNLAGFTTLELFSLRASEISSATRAWFQNCKGLKTLVLSNLASGFFNLLGRDGEMDHRDLEALSMEARNGCTFSTLVFGAEISQYRHLQKLGALFFLCNVFLLFIGLNRTALLASFA